MDHLPNVKISVITVVFNGERYLDQTIKSVIDQNYKNIEYIIIDGGSTDGTLAIIEKYRSAISKIVSEKDNGLSDAMNKGARLATGDWVIYLHADDTFTDKNSINYLVDAAASLPEASWVTGYRRLQDSEGHIFKEDDWQKISWQGMLLRNLIRHQATMVKKDLLLINEFRDEFRYAMDYDFFLRIWAKYNNPIIIEKHIVDFRLDGRNLSSDYYASLKDEMKARIKFRKENRKAYILMFDYVIYMFRYLKIKFIHNRNNVR